MKNYSLLFLCLTASAVMALRSDGDRRDGFQQFFYATIPRLQEIMETDCALGYRSYVEHVEYDPTFDCLTGKGKNSVMCWSSHMLTCILDNTAEADKANLAGASVILGLVPTTLALAGFNTVEIALLSLRRPFLAFLIGLSSPAVLPTTLANYRDLQTLLTDEPPLFLQHVSELGSWSQSAVVALEYLVVLAAVGNLGYVTYELCVKTVCSFALNVSFLPATWIAAAMIVQILGTITLHFQVRFRPIARRQGYAISATQHGSLLEPQRQGDDGRNLNGREDTVSITNDTILHRIISSWGRVLRQEAQLSASQQRRDLEYRPDTFYFWLFSWATSVGIILVIIWGTIVLSSSVLINTANAFIVVARMLGSVLAARLVLSFEVYGVGTRTSLRDDGKPRRTTTLQARQRYEGVDGNGDNELDVIRQAKTSSRAVYS